MAFETLNEEQILEFREVFSKADADSDGYCTATELMDAFKGIGQDCTEEQIADMIKEFDVPDSRKPNTLEFPEFLHFVAKKVQEHQEDKELQEAFAVFDQDKDGLISIDELRAVMRDCLRQLMPEDQLNHLMQQADSNQDNHIDFQEFKKIMET